MNKPNFLVNLKKKISPTSWPWLIAALRQDNLVWQSLTRTELGQQALVELPNQAEAWSPAALALLELQYPQNLEDVKSLPLKPLSNPVRKMAERAIRERREEEASASFNLRTAGLVALMMREKGLNHLWEVDDLVEGKYSPQEIGSIITILFGMLSSPLDFLRGVFQPGAPKLHLELALHALLSNPLPPSEQEPLLENYLKTLSSSDRLTGLRYLKTQRPELAARLAEQLPLARSKSSIPKSKSIQTEAPEHLNYLADLGQTVDAYRLSRQPGSAIPVLIKALKSTRLYQAHLAAQLGEAAAENNDFTTAIEAWKQAVQLNPDSPAYTAHLLSTWLEAGKAEEAQAYLQAKREEKNLPEDSSLYLSAALIAKHFSETEALHRESRKAFARLLTIHRKPGDSWQDELGPEQLQKLINLLFESGALQEAEQAAKMLTAVQPVDAPTLKTLAEIQLRLDKPHEALEAIQLAAAQASKLSEVSDLLITCLEQADEWQAALEERSIQAASEDQVTSETLRELAYCALKADQPEAALDACRKALQIDAEDGLSFSLLGEAYSAMGDHIAAVENFRQATELVPHLPAPWMSLAQAHQKSGESARAMEVLRAASLAASTAPELYLALGKAYLGENSPTQALTAFRRAVALNANDEISETTSNLNAKNYGRRGLEPASTELSTEIALYLGRTLHQLAHYSEALQVLESEYAKDPNNTEISHIYARTLLSLGDKEATIHPLETVLASRPDDPTICLEYVRALSQHVNWDAEKARRAIPLLEHVLELTPKDTQENDEALALLAEAYFEANEPEKARIAFLQSLDTRLAESGNWHARLSYGLGQSALMLGQNDAAIASLQDAAQSNPQDGNIQRALSKAYYAIDLPSDSFEAAQSALQSNPNDLDTLVWFADQVLLLNDTAGGAKLNALTKAIKALNQAVRIAAERADLLVRLGSAHIKNGDNTAALAVFREIASGKAEDTGEPLKVESLDLFKAGRELRRLGDPQTAITCLERATLASQENEREERSSEGDLLLVDLLVELSLAHHAAGDDQMSLDVLEQAIQLNPFDTILHLNKADLLFEMGDLKAAMECLEDALESAPEEDENGEWASMHLRASHLLRVLGDLRGAIRHTVQAIATKGHNSDLAYFTAAELTRANLEPKRAWTILENRTKSTDGDPAPEQNWLQIELALDRGDDELAAKSLETAMELAPNEPRTLAAKARLQARRGDHPGALDILQRAIKAIEAASGGSADLLINEQGHNGSYQAIKNLCDWRAVSEAASETGQWDAGIYFLRQIVDAFPQELYSQLQLIRALVLRAEAQRLCEAMDVVQHAPGSSALADKAYQSFEKSIQAAYEIIAAGDNVQSPLDMMGEFPQQDDPKGELRRWHARGQAAFHPEPESVKALQSAPHSPDVIAAMVTTYSYFGAQDAARRVAQAYPQHPWVLLKLALAISEINPRQSLGIAQTAVHYLSQRTYERPHETPLRYYLLARLAHKAEDPSTALQSIKTALGYWPEEPRWHNLAADINLRYSPADDLPNWGAAIHHMELATSLEPRNADNFLKLGKIYLEVRDFIQAIHALEQASRLAPEKSEIWLALADVQAETGDFQRAASNADIALEHDPHNTSALLMRGKIAVQLKDPQMARDCAQQILALKSNDPEALQLLAQALHAMKQPMEALDALERALPLVEKPLPLLLERASILQESHGLDTALRALKELAEHYPDEPQVLAPLGEALMEAGQNEAAVHTAKLALRAENSALGAESMARLHYLVGRHLRKTGQLDQAVYHLNEASQIAPTHLEYLLELGRIHQERRQHGQAISVYQKAMQISTEDYRPFFQAGLSLKETKDYLGAENMLRKAAELAPDDVSIHRLLGAVVALNLVHNRQGRPSIQR